MNCPPPEAPNDQDIVNALSAVCASASVAVTVNESVAAELCSVCVPVIVQLPTPVVNVKPVAIAPVVIAKDVAFVAVKVCVAIAEPPSKVPKEPLPVTHAGASETVSIAVVLLTELPSGFSTLKKYVPSIGKVKVAVIDVP